MTTYISKEQYEKLKKELEYLKTVEIKKIAERIRVAREFGDISENAEYEIAMNEKENLMRKITEIENILKTAKIIKNNPKITDRILPGKIFETLEKETNKKHVFQLVGFGESDPANGKISTESPLGKAFLNKKVGDIVKVQTPKGKVTYKITKIIND
jgi:transcription elongation factor GreA